MGYLTTWSDPFRILVSLAFDFRPQNDNPGPGFYVRQMEMASCGPSFSVKGSTGFPSKVIYRKNMYRLYMWSTHSPIL